VSSSFARARWAGFGLAAETLTLLRLIFCAPVTDCGIHSEQNCRTLTYLLRVEPSERSFRKTIRTFMSDALQVGFGTLNRLKRPRNQLDTFLLPSCHAGGRGFESRPSRHFDFNRMRYRKHRISAEVMANAIVHMAFGQRLPQAHEVAGVRKRRGPSCRGPCLVSHG